MNYAYRENGVWSGPVAMRRQFGDAREIHLMTDAERAKLGWFPCDVVGESFDPRTQSRSSAPVSYDFDGSTVTATFLIVDKSIEAIRDDLLAELAATRWHCETAGIDVDGQRVFTTRESQSQISATFSALSSGLVTSIDWKAPGGWVTVTLVEFEPIAQAVAAHVQKCFTAEKIVSQQIEAAIDIADLVAIEITAAFNAAYSESSA